MAIYRPTSFWFVFWTETSRCVYTRKKYRGRSEAILTEQAWSIKDMVLFRGTACNPEGARSHLVRSGRQYQCRIWLTLHTRGARCIRDGLLF